MLTLDLKPAGSIFSIFVQNHLMDHKISIKTKHFDNTVYLKAFYNFHITQRLEQGIQKKSPYVKITAQKPIYQHELIDQSLITKNYLESFTPNFTTDHFKDLVQV